MSLVLFLHLDISHGRSNRRTGGKHSTTHKTKSKEAKSSGGVAPSPVCSSRDASIFLFKSLGKILYCKSKFIVV